MKLVKIKIEHKPLTIASGYRVLSMQGACVVSVGAMPKEIRVAQHINEKDVQNLIDAGHDVTVVA